jgi:hypothetical protein
MRSKPQSSQQMSAFIIFHFRYDPKGLGYYCDECFKIRHPWYRLPTTWVYLADFHGPEDDWALHEEVVGISMQAFPPISLFCHLLDCAIRADSPGFLYVAQNYGEFSKGGEGYGRWDEHRGEVEESHGGYG